MEFKDEEDTEEEEEEARERPSTIDRVSFNRNFSHLLPGTRRLGEFTQTYTTVSNEGLQ